MRINFKPAQSHDSIWPPTPHASKCSKSSVGSRPKKKILKMAASGASSPYNRTSSPYNRAATPYSRTQGRDPSPVRSTASSRAGDSISIPDIERNRFMSPVQDSTPPSVDPNGIAMPPIRPLSRERVRSHEFKGRHIQMMSLGDLFILKTDNRRYNRSGSSLQLRKASIFCWSGPVSPFIHCDGDCHLFRLGKTTRTPNRSQ